MNNTMNKLGEIQYAFKKQKKTMGENSTNFYCFLDAYLISKLKDRPYFFALGFLTFKNLMLGSL